MGLPSGRGSSFLSGPEFLTAVAFMAPAFGVGFLSVTAFTNGFGSERFTGAVEARTVRNLLGVHVLPLLMGTDADVDRAHWRTSQFRVGVVDEGDYVEVGAVAAVLAVEVVGLGAGHIDKRVVAVSDEDEEALVLKHLKDGFTPKHLALCGEVVRLGGEAVRALQLVAAHDGEHQAAFLRRF
jgi:hypothetical protein